MKRAIFGLLLAAAGCKSEAGTVLQIIEAPAFADDCSIPATPTLYQPEGFFDPTGLGDYSMALYLQNNSNDQENPASIPGDPNIRPSANDASVVGYDYCFYRTDTDDTTAYDPKAKGFVVDCDDLPDAQRGFVTSSSLVPAGGGTRTTFISVLSAADQRTLFGDAFNPRVLLNTNDDPTNLATRNAAWGNFPQAFTARVNVNVRARAERQDGGTMRSNWFSFPVDICPRCVSSRCATISVTCTNGSPGIQGTQVPPSCPTAYSGAAFTCEDVDTCS